MIITVLTGPENSNSNNLTNKDWFRNIAFYPQESENQLVCYLSVDFLFVLKKWAVILIFIF